MIKLTITIDKSGEGECKLEISGHGEQCCREEIKLAQRIQSALEKYVKPGVIETITPHIETIIRAEDRPQAN